MPLFLKTKLLSNNRDNIEEIIGVVRCARCGHRLEGEIECPFCSLFRESTRSNVLPKWIYITACFFTSPLSIYFIFKNNRLSTLEKVFTLSGCLLWFALFCSWPHTHSWYLRAWSCCSQYLLFLVLFQEIVSTAQELAKPCQMILFGIPPTGLVGVNCIVWYLPADILADTL